MSREWYILVFYKGGWIGGRSVYGILDTIDLGGKGEL